MVAHDGGEHPDEPVSYHGALVAPTAGVRWFTQYGLYEKYPGSY